MPTPRETIDAEWEVLPPEEKAKRSEVEPLFRWLALIMDNFLRVPGTQFRFGLDPLMGLLPGLGDTGSAIISAMALVAAARRGLPKILLARMSLNILINEAIGIIPVVGDAFSFWFKSNVRNYELLRRHTAAPHRSSKSDWVFVALVLGALGLILLVSLAVSFWLLYAVAKLLG
ncbi:MAG TPA: DUF4112 domain-containing protein [Chthoniobacterales bacterium]|jgi:hypothetical protein|nr:DUF4112 domain-containing protein [Chthoniobacterales bacterium]